MTHSCLNPLVALTHPLAFLFTKTAKLFKEKLPLIHDHYFVMSPLSLSYVIKKFLIHMIVDFFKINF